MMLPTRPDGCKIFNLSELLETSQGSDEPWLEFLRVPSMRAGLYVLAPGRGITRHRTLKTRSTTC